MKQFEEGCLILALIGLGLTAITILVVVINR